LVLGMHLNSDESMALGAAFHGANVSTSFKVRHVGLADVNPFPISVDLADLTTNTDKKAGGGLFGIGRKKKDTIDPKEDEWNKHATVFKLGSKLGSKKTIAFSYEKDVHVSIDYEESDSLPIGTGLSIEQYDVSGIAEFAKEMVAKDLGTPKVSLQFELSTSGLAQLIKAEATVEETYMVEEEVEIEDDDDVAEESTGKEGDNSTKKDEEKAKEGAETSSEEVKEAEKSDDEAKDVDGDKVKEEASNGDEKKVKKDDKKKKKKKKTEKVQVEKKKKHVRTLEVRNYYVGRIQPYSPEMLIESEEKMALLAETDKARMMLEEAKNKFEGYIYYIRNKLADDEEIIGKVTSEEQRDALRQSAEDAEEWMYDDGYTADMKTYEEKYTNLSEPAKKAFSRAVELNARPEAIKLLSEKLEKVEELVKKWETSMTQVTADERGEIFERITEVRKWISEKVEEQEKTDPTEEPVFTSEEVPKQTKKLESLIGKLMKKPKPKPVETKKNETDKNETVSSESTDADEGDDKEGESSESNAAKDEEAEDKDAKDEEAKDEEVKDDDSKEESNDEF